MRSPSTRALIETTSAPVMPRTVFAASCTAASAALAKLSGDEPMIVITGHAASGSSARRLLDSGRALFQRWNVHPTFADNLRLIGAVDPRRVVPVFGEDKFLPLWRERIAPREIVGTTPVAL